MSFPHLESVPTRLVSPRLDSATVSATWDVYLDADWNDDVEAMLPCLRRHLAPAKKTIELPLSEDPGAL